MTKRTTQNHGLTTADETLGVPTATRTITTLNPEPSTKRHKTHTSPNVEKGKLAVTSSPSSDPGEESGLSEEQEPVPELDNDDGWETNPESPGGPRHEHRKPHKKPTPPPHYVPAPGAPVPESPITPDGLKPFIGATAKSFFNSAILEIMVRNTNAEAIARESPHWKPVSEKEMTVWLGMVYYLISVSPHAVEDLWNTDWHRPLYPVRYYMEQERFIAIMENFRLTPPGELEDQKPDLSEYTEDGELLFRGIDPIPIEDEYWQGRGDVNLWLKHVQPLFSHIRNVLETTYPAITAHKLEKLEKEQKKGKGPVVLMRNYHGAFFDAWGSVIWNRKQRRRLDFFRRFEETRVWYRAFFYALDVIWETAREVTKMYPELDPKRRERKTDFVLDFGWELIHTGNEKQSIAIDEHERMAGAEDESGTCSDE